MTLSLAEIKRVLKPGDRSLVQMPNRRALRSLLVLASRGFSEGSEFDVRYYSIGELLQLFSQHIGQSDWRVDGFLGLNVHAYDRKFVRPSRRLIIDIAEALRRVSDTLRFLRPYADSVLVNSVKACHQRNPRG
jgi:endo-1,4-beta-D-glucanase Y